MARGREDWKAIHAEAVALEVRLARSLRKSFTTMRTRCPLVDLADAVAARDVGRAMAVLTRVAPEDALHPAGEVVRTAFERGGRVGADAVRRT